MDGDWETIKSKPKNKKAKVQNDEQQKQQFGGRGAKGKLIAGPIKTYNNAQTYNQPTDFSVLNNQASAIADFDYHIDDEQEETKFE